MAILRTLSTNSIHPSASFTTMRLPVGSKKLKPTRRCQTIFQKTTPPLRSSCILADDSYTARTEDTTASSSLRSILPPASCLLSSAPRPAATGHEISVLTRPANSYSQQTRDQTKSTSFESTSKTEESIKRRTPLKSPAPTASASYSSWHTSGLTTLLKGRH